jgi:5-methylcytosine-specific restriction protein A
MPSAPPQACPCGGRRVNGKCDRCGPRKENRKNFRQRGYTTQWSNASSLFLQANPLCRACEQRGIVTAAYCTDHIVPHKGNMELFWDQSNWQPLCRQCHAVKSARE